VIANEKNPPETVGGILQMSGVIVVSAESISMVSEAIASGKPVVVFRLAKKRPGIAKHDRALAALEKEGYITVCDARDTARAISQVWGKACGARADDKEKLAAAVKRLI
jgi:mitochondrial fission protein ELM1